MGSLGQRIKQRREELGLDQVELAKRVGISQPTLANLESGKNARTRFLPELARELRTTVETLSGQGSSTSMPARSEALSPRAVDSKDVLELLQLFADATPDSRPSMLELLRLFSDATLDGRIFIIDAARSAAKSASTGGATANDHPQ